MRAKAVAEVADIFNSGSGVSYLFERMVRLVEKRLQIEESQRARCPYGGRHNEYETCDVCDCKR
jgi:hypothetical protein